MGDRGRPGGGGGGGGGGASALAIPFMGGFFFGAGMTSSIIYFLVSKEPEPSRQTPAPAPVTPPPARKRRRCTCKVASEIVSFQSIFKALVCYKCAGHDSHSLISQTFSIICR